VKFLGQITALAAAAMVAAAPSSTAFAQRQQPTPEQRIDRLERQVNEVQRRVFPKGKPADTAGFADDPAATQSSVIGLNQRLDALERQIADVVRQTEENGNRLRSIESGMTQLKSEQDQKIQALEQRLSEATAAAAAAPAATEAAPPAATTTTPPKAKPKTGSKPPKTAEAESAPAPASDSGDEGSETAAATDPGEDAYSQGFHQWEAGQYDEAISTLKSFVSDYPKHRRVSYANNLIGRALLDKGDARAAATALLSNYRGNPGGERAPDSLYYLGQALSKLGQSTQACRAYDELDAVYGAKIRPDLKKLETDAKAQDKCS
jgi:TolA-binding protein